MAADSTTPVNGAAPETDGTIAARAHYAPPWADVSIIGIAGSSGSGKSTLSHAIVNKLNLPWVVILSMVSYHGQFRRDPDADLSVPNIISLR